MYCQDASPVRIKHKLITLLAQSLSGVINNFWVLTLRLINTSSDCDCDYLTIIRRVCHTMIRLRAPNTSVLLPAR